MTGDVTSKKNPWPAIVLGVIVAAWIVLNLAMSPSSPQPVVCGTDVNPDAGTVVMLSASWCGYCRRARAYMHDKGIAHCEYDVESTPEGRRQFAEMPVKMVPVLKIGDDTLIGFSPGELQHALVANGLADLADYGD